MHGLNVFFAPRSILVSESISRRIDDALRTSRLFIAWYSDHYLDSQACLMELTRTLAQRLGTRSIRTNPGSIVINPRRSPDHIRPAWLRGLKLETYSDLTNDIDDLASRIATAVGRTDFR